MPRPEAERLLHVERISSVRLNPLGGRSTAETAATLHDTGIDVEPIPWCDDAFWVTGDKRELAAHALVRDGHAYLQNASSLVPVLALAPQPGDAVLDVCAAPGGKAIHIAGLTDNRGRLWLNDANAARVRTMEALLAAYDAAPAAVTTHRGEYIDKHVTETFDRILLDAQCSGEGRIDFRHPRAMRFWSPGRIAKFAKLQKRMTASAYKLLRPGGTLVYATCTFAPEENEAVLDHLLVRFPDAVIEPIGVALPPHRPALTSFEGERFHPAVAAAIRVMPSARQEGFFVARVRRP